MPLHITTPDGEAVTTISVQPSVDTVHQVCVRISETTRIPELRQQLLLADKELQHDVRTLAEHGVVADSTIQLVNGDWG